MPADTNRVSDPLSPATTAARACAQGWAEVSREHDARRWTAPIPQRDHDYFEQEILGRDATEEESAEFSRAFIDEYNACMQQQADRENPIDFEMTDLPVRAHFSHRIDPASRAPICGGYMYHGDTVATIGDRPTCHGCRKVLETDALGREQERRVEAAPYITTAVEVKYGSGKVKV